MGGALNKGLRNVNDGEMLGVSILIYYPRAIKAHV